MLEFLQDSNIDWNRLKDVAGDILGFQVIPHVLSLTVNFLIEKEQYDWYSDNVRIPFWGVLFKRINTVFAVLHTGMGLASFLVFQKNIGWVSPAVPLVLCGVQVIADFTWRPLFFNQKNWDRAFRHGTACTLLSSALCYLYYKIDWTAGVLMVPYSLWWFYLTSVVWYIRLANDPPEPWRRLSFGGFERVRRPTVPTGSVSD